MRNLVIRLSLLGSLGIFCLTSGLFEHAFMFVLFGMLPGMDVPLEPAAMLSLWSLGAGLLLGILTQTYLRRAVSQSTIPGRMA